MEAFKSRKFLLTVGYVAIFVANYVLNWGITTQDLLVLGGIVGVYNVANVAQKTSAAVDETEEAYEAVVDLYKEAVGELDE